MTLEDTIATTLRALAEDAPDAGPVLSTIQNRVRVEAQQQPRRRRRRRRRVSVVLAATAVASIAIAVTVVVNRADNPAPPASNRLSTAAIPGVLIPTPPGQLIDESERRQAPPFRLPLLDGSGMFDLADHQGHVVVMTWFASWCPPCRTEIRQESDLGSLDSAGVDAVTIDHMDDRAPARRFFASQKTTSSVVFDGKGGLMRKFPISVSGQGEPVQLLQGIPMTVLLDRQHRVAAVYVRHSKPDTLLLLKAVERLAS